jgi:hypothetical protein
LRLPLVDRHEPMCEAVFELLDDRRGPWSNKCVKVLRVVVIDAWPSCRERTGR